MGKLFIKRINELIDALSDRVYSLIRIIQLIICPLVVIIIGDMESLNTMVIAVIIIGVNILLQVLYVSVCDYEDEEYNKIPIPPKRFTKRNPVIPGELTIDKDDIEELIIYMIELEDFIEWHGVKLDKKE